MASPMEWVTNRMVFFSPRLPDPQQLALQEFAGLGVEGGERLVEDQHLRVVGEDARDRRALAHTTRKLVR